MSEWLVRVTEFAVLAIDWVALFVISGGTIEAIVGLVRVLAGHGDNHARRLVWLRYARWLVAALTFQLAADIIETSIRSDWESIARIGAVGVIRTFLNYFLERDVVEVRERDRASLERT